MRLKTIASRSDRSLSERGSDMFLGDIETQQRQVDAGALSRITAIIRRSGGQKSSKRKLFGILIEKKNKFGKQ